MKRLSKYILKFNVACALLACFAILILPTMRRGRVTDLITKSHPWPNIVCRCNLSSLAIALRHIDVFLMKEESTSILERAIWSTANIARFVVPDIVNRGVILSRNFAQDSAKGWVNIAVEPVREE